MKTFTQNLLKAALFVVLSASAVIANGQTSIGEQSSKNPLINLPVSFTTVLTNNKVEVKFSTEIEKNLNHIIVERSVDGVNYNDAGLVFTYGTTTAKSDYMLPDNISKLRSAGVIYYRLKVVNGDGTIQYSEVRTVRMASVVIG